MDIKDCKFGTRVVCTNPDHDNVIPVGAVGTIIENNSTIPWVSFDDEYSLEQKEVLGYKNCKVMDIEEIEVLVERSSKETNIGKLTVSLSTEDANEIAKDILKIVLKDLNVIISDAIESLSNDRLSINSLSDDNLVDDKQEGKQPLDVTTAASNVDFSEEKLQSMFEEVMKDVMKEYLRDSINTLNKTAFGI